MNEIGKFKKELIWGEKKEEVCELALNMDHRRDNALYSDWQDFKVRVQLSTFIGVSSL